MEPFTYKLFPTVFALLDDMSMWFSQTESDTSTDRVRSAQIESDTVMHHELVVTAHDLLESFDSDTQADALVLDFSKAFDTAPHRKLLSKLEAYGIN